MTKVKILAVFSAVLFLVILLLPTLVQPVKALGGGNSWYEYWSSNPTVQYGDYPQNISSQVTVCGSDYNWWLKVAVVISVYEYNQYYGVNTVNFRVALYFDSFASESMPAPRPVPADFVTIETAQHNNPLEKWYQGLCRVFVSRCSAL